MNKYKILLKNIGILMLGNFGSKILSFLMIPIYTNALTTSEYGTYDIVSTTISLLISILSLNIYDAVIRFSLDEEQNRRTEIFNIGNCVTIIGILIISFFTLINYKLNSLPLFKEYGLFFVLLYIASVFYNIQIAYAKALEQIFTISVAGVLSTLIGVILNIIFLIVIPSGLSGYFAANIVGLFIPALYMAYKTKTLSFARFCIIDTKLLKEMLKYSIPLVFSSLGWWLNNALDKYVVTWICGTAVNGIYAVAYKLPNAISVIQNLFEQAWLLSVVKEYGKKGFEDFFFKIYQIYNFIMLLICMLFLSVTKPLAYILFANEFYSAWEFAPFLMMAVVFNALGGFLIGIFSAIKSSKIIGTSTIIGGVTNFLLNILLIYQIGAMGAAIATLISSILIWVIRIVFFKKISDVKIIYVKDIASYMLLFLQCLNVLLQNDISSYIALTLILGAIFLYINREILISISKKIIIRVKKYTSH